jgi:hypothetical protein
MKLADIEIDDLVQALGRERSAWVNLATEQGRPHTEAERSTICFLAALEHALAQVPQRDLPATGLGGRLL